jgi:exosortase C (VPDSG-CTERM-specific)
MTGIASARRDSWRAFAIAALVLALCFGLPLYRLVRFAVDSTLYSHILLMPLVSAYLIWLRRDRIQSPSHPACGLTVFGLVAGMVMMAGAYVGHSARTLAEADYLTWTIAAFLFLLLALGAWFLGRETLRTIAFPAGILLFCVPFPVVLEKGFQSFLQHGSATAAHGLFIVSGMPVFNEGTTFRLPGFCLEVAPECSGIHSTLVLLIVSLLVGSLFLRTPWKRAVLVLAVVPLGILRNAVRILVIGQLCVRIGPEMIDSPIHHRGGPLFFVLSLAPLFLLAWMFWRTDRIGDGPESSKAR